MLLCLSFFFYAFIFPNTYHPLLCWIFSPYCLRHRHTTCGWFLIESGFNWFFIVHCYTSSIEIVYWLLLFPSRWFSDRLLVDILLLSISVGWWLRVLSLILFRFVKKCCFQDVWVNATTTMILFLFFTTLSPSCLVYDFSIINRCDLYLIG